MSLERRSKFRSCQYRDLGLIPGSGRSPEVGNGNPLQYSCLKNGQRSLAGYIVLAVAESDMSEHVSSVEMVLKVLTLKKITIFYMPPATHGPHFTGIPNSKYSLCRSEAIQSGRRGLWLPWLLSTFPSIRLKFAVLHALSSQGRDTVSIRGFHMRPTNDSHVHTDWKKKKIPPKQKRKINKNYLKVFKEKFCKDLLAKAA